MSNLEPMDDVTQGDPGRPGMGLGEGFTAPRSGGRFPTQFVILLLIVGVSAAALYGMRRYGMKSGIKFDTVETEFKDTDTQKARTYERIMADLASVQKPLDIALGDFGKSPFMHETAPNLSPKVDLSQPGQTDAERRRQEAYTALKTMHLNGIIGNIARIDEQTVKAGDKVGDLFTVKAVEGRAVVFDTTWGEEFRLEMETKKAQPHGSPTKMRALQDRR